LHVLSKLSKTQQIIPTSIELVDIAGLVKGASKGEVCVPLLFSASIYAAQGILSKFDMDSHEGIN
jgi:hypothetical protein